MSLIQAGEWTSVNYRRCPRRVQFFESGSCEGPNAHTRCKDRAFSNSQGSWTKSFITDPNPMADGWTTIMYKNRKP